MRWSTLFRAIRLLELSGELLSGHFFNGIKGAQFASPEAFRVMARRRDPDAVFWLCATDPIAVCAMGIDGLTTPLPRRVPSNHLVYRGSQLVMVSERNGRALTFHVPASDPDLITYLGVLRHLVYRKSNPVKQLTIETINDEPATRSPYLDAIGTAFDINHDHRAVYIERTV